MATSRGTSAKGIHDARYRALIDVLMEERKRQKLSQQAFADRLGRHQQFVSRYETGERRLDVVEFVDIARSLGLEPADMLRSISE